MRCAVLIHHETAYALYTHDMCVHSAYAVCLCEAKIYKMSAPALGVCKAKTKHPFRSVLFWKLLLSFNRKEIAITD